MSDIIMFTPRSEGFCKYNPMIDCNLRLGCQQCGWNPDISERRIAKLHEMMDSMEKGELNFDRT